MPKTQPGRVQPLSLILLTGFLGSGKTSVLRHWLEQTTTPLERTAVIINDFGAVNVDAALLARRRLELSSITGGCVCCQSFEDLVEQVRLLADNPAIDLAWIETSGLADPEEVLDHLSAPSLQQDVRLGRMVLVIDGSDFPCSWRGRAVQAEQASYADLIVINKTDLIDEAKRQRIEIALRQMNPGAEIISVTRGQIEPDLLASGATSGRSFAVEEPCGCDHEHHHHDEHAGHDHAHGHDHDHDDSALPHAASTLFLPLEKPVERRAFQQFLGSLPTSVFRAKGFVRLTEAPAQLYTFQQVRDQAELLLLPLENADHLPTGLVLIGPHLDHGQIRDLARALVPEPAIRS